MISTLSHGVIGEYVGSYLSFAMLMGLGKDTLELRGVSTEESPTLKV